MSSNQVFSAQSMLMNYQSNRVNGSLINKSGFSSNNIIRDSKLKENCIKSLRTHSSSIRHDANQQNSEINIRTSVNNLLSSQHSNRNNSPRHEEGKLERETEQNKMLETDNNEFELSNKVVEKNRQTNSDNKNNVVSALSSSSEENVPNTVNQADAKRQSLMHTKIRNLSREKRSGEGNELITTNEVDVNELLDNHEKEKKKWTSLKSNNKCELVRKNENMQVKLETPTSTLPFSGMKISSSQDNKYCESKCSQEACINNVKYSVPSLRASTSENLSAEQHTENIELNTKLVKPNAHITDEEHSCKNVRPLFSFQLDMQNLNSSASNSHDNNDVSDNISFVKSIEIKEAIGSMKTSDLSSNNNLSAKNNNNNNNAENKSCSDNCEELVDESMEKETRRECTNVKINIDDAIYEANCCVSNNKNNDNTNIIKNSCADQEDKTTSQVQNECFEEQKQEIITKTNINGVQVNDNEPNSQTTSNLEKIQLVEQSVFTSPPETSVPFIRPAIQTGKRQYYSTTLPSPYRYSNSQIIDFFDEEQSNNAKSEEAEMQHTETVENSTHQSQQTEKCQIKQSESSTEANTSSAQEAKLFEMANNKLGSATTAHLHEEEEEEQKKERITNENEKRKETEKVCYLSSSSENVKTRELENHRDVHKIILENGNFAIDENIFSLTSEPEKENLMKKEEQDGKLANITTTARTRTRTTTNTSNNQKAIRREGEKCNNKCYNDQCIALASAVDAIDEHKEKFTNTSANDNNNDNSNSNNKSIIVKNRNSNISISFLECDAAEQKQIASNNMTTLQHENSELSNYNYNVFRNPLNCNNNQVKAILQSNVQRNSNVNSEAEFIKRASIDALQQRQSGAAGTKHTKDLVSSLDAVHVNTNNERKSAPYLSNVEIHDFLTSEPIVNIYDTTKRSNHIYEEE